MKQLTIGEILRFYRMRAGFTQFELESKSGMSQGSLSRIEANIVSPSKETLMSIINTLQLDAKDSALLFGINFYRPIDPNPAVDPYKLHDNVPAIFLGDEGYREMRTLHCNSSS